MESSEALGQSDRGDETEFLGDASATTAPEGASPESWKTADREFIAIRYELFEEVGRGGMGVVYRARHKNLNRPVALKLMQPHAGMKRFHHEARLLARVKSPHVVGVHDLEILPSGCSFISMEWIEGSTLQKQIQAGRLDEQKALAWMRQTCEGMIAVSENGIIHRDLKPSNLLIDEKSHARVADFGLARGESALDELTRTEDMILGTPLYMAPEQAEDPLGIDTRADIYSFGATYYHALIGSPPFTGTSAFSILFKHKTETLTSPRAHRPQLSERTCEVLERCLAKSPSERFSSFKEVLENLRTDGGATSPWIMDDDRELTVYLDRYRARRAFYLGETPEWNRELDRYEFPRGQTLRIVVGDITAQSTDAIVSSDTGYLLMGAGVSLAIRERGGDSIVKEAEAFAPIRPGRAVVTAAGRLPARFVFHVATVGLASGELVRPSRDLINEMMASCFYHSDTLDVRSIAFPLLGTGAQRFPREKCLDTMFQYLARMFLRGLTSVHEALIVIYPIAEH